MWSGIKKRCLYFSLHHRWEISRRRPSQNRIRRVRGASSSKKRRKSVEISGAHSFRKRKSSLCAFSRVHATKTLGTTGCRSSGHENLPDFSLSLSSSLTRSLGLLALTSFAAPGSIFKCAHCRASRCGVFSEKKRTRHFPILHVSKRDCSRCAFRSRS